MSEKERIFVVEATKDINEISDLWKDKQNNRTINFMFEDSETLTMDVFDDETEVCIFSVKVNLKKGNGLIEVAGGVK